MESGSKALRAPDIVKSIRVIVSPLALQTHKFDPVIAHGSGKGEACTLCWPPINPGVYSPGGLPMTDRLRQMTIPVQSDSLETPISQTVARLAMPQRRDLLGWVAAGFCRKVAFSRVCESVSH